MMGRYSKILYKSTLLSIPIITILLLYIVLDPFKVIWNYKSFYPSPITLNKDYVSTQTFKNNSLTYKYNSFIFGNSRSIFYEINTRKKYIHTENCFHFDAMCENLLGIDRKINFLNNKKVLISHALIILDYQTLSNFQPLKGHLTLIHPDLSNQNWVTFQMEYFKTFLLFDFLFAYLDYKYSSQVKDYMKNSSLLSDNFFTYNSKYNEMRFNLSENEIKLNPLQFYNKQKMLHFYSRDTIQRYSPQLIAKLQYKMLYDIATILKKNKTAYKIIINPLYDQLKLNKTAANILCELFGKENVYDFSGINSITNDYHNYYEESHYRPHIADYIMKTIYKR